MRTIWTFIIERGGQTWTPVAAYSNREDAIGGAERDWKITHRGNRPPPWEVVPTDPEMTVAYPDKRTTITVFPLRLEETA